MDAVHRPFAFAVKGNHAPTRRMIVMLALAACCLGACGAFPGSPSSTPPSGHTSIPCISTTMRPRPTSTPRIPPSSTPTPQPSPTLVHTLPGDLPSGQHVVFYWAVLDGALGWTRILDIVGTDGNSRGRLATLGTGHSAAISPDMQRIAFRLDDRLVFMTLEDQSLSQVPAGENCFSPTWSPDGAFLVAVCETPLTSRETPLRYSLYLIDLRNGEREMIASIESLSEASYSTPQWSPDGMRISFLRLYGPSSVGPGYDSRDGLYLLDTSCLAQPSACQIAMRGPIFGRATCGWAPDSQRLACANGGSEIDIINLNGDLLTSFSVGGSVWAPSWSPDGAWIAFTRSIDLPEVTDSINVLSVADGRTIQLIDDCHAGCYASFWLNIP